MRPMTEGELLTQLLNVQGTPETVINALVEFLDANGFHDSSRELARMRDAGELNTRGGFPF